MSNRKWLYILIAVLALVLVAGIALLLIHPAQEGNVQTPTEEQTEGTTTVPMQDSIFDDVTKPSDVAQPTQGTTEPTVETTEPTQSTEKTTTETTESAADVSVEPVGEQLPPERTLASAVEPEPEKDPVVHVVIRQTQNDRNLGDVFIWQGLAIVKEAFIEALNK